MESRERPNGGGAGGAGCSPFLGGKEAPAVRELGDTPTAPWVGWGAHVGGSGCTRVPRGHAKDTQPQLIIYNYQAVRARPCAERLTQFHLFWTLV